MRPASPYLAPGFYETALAQGRHRDIVGGRWDETGRVQLALLQAEGMAPQHRLLDIGCGSLRLGCKAVPFLEPGHYWGTDASRALMLRGRATELPDPDRLPETQLIADDCFAFPGLPARIDYAIAFGVFAHLPTGALQTALIRVAARFPDLRAFLFTVFLAPEGCTGSLRQPDGVVTHPDRAPRHLPEIVVRGVAEAAGLQIVRRDDRLPRGQVLFLARPA